MGAGRRPKPAAMHLYNGNPSHLSQADLKGAENPQPELAVPEMPKGMPKGAKREWKRIVPMLMDVGVLSTIDGLALSAYCRAVAMVEMAQKDIDKHGLLFAEMYWDKKTEEMVAGDLKANPAVGICNTYMKTMKAFLIEFGLTPAARRNLKIEKKDADDPLALMMKNKRMSGPQAVPTILTPVSPADMTADDEPTPQEPSDES